MPTEAAPCNTPAPTPCAATRLHRHAVRHQRAHIVKEKECHSRHNPTIRRAKRLGSRSTVGNYKTACAELDTAEVAYHNHKHIRKFFAMYLPQDRLACRTRRLTVVIGALMVATLSKPVGITYVARIVVLLLVRFYMFLYLLYCSDRNGESKKLAPLFGIYGLTLPFNGLVYIFFGHILLFYILFKLPHAGSKQQQ